MKRWAVPPLRVRVSKCQGTSADIYMTMIHDSHPRPQRLNRVSLGCADSQRLITLIPNREHGEREDGFRSGLDFSSNATRSLGWLGGVRMDRRDGEPATHRATEPRPEPWRVCYPGKSDSARSAWQGSVRKCHVSNFMCIDHSGILRRFMGVQSRWHGDGTWRA